ncbi:hypothetical protein ACMFMG_003038 [Clarireedia jacksonii]
MMHDPHFVAIFHQAASAWDFYTTRIQGSRNYEVISSWGDIAVAFPQGFRHNCNELIQITLKCSKTTFENHIKAHGNCGYGHNCRGIFHRVGKLKFGNPHNREKQIQPPAMRSGFLITGLSPGAVNPLHRSVTSFFFNTTPEIPYHVPVHLKFLG